MWKRRTAIKHFQPWISTELESLLDTSWITENQFIYFHKMVAAGHFWCPKVRSWWTFWRHAERFDVWRTFWRYDVFLKSWRTVWRHEVYCYVMTYFWHHDVMFGGYNVFLRSWYSLLCQHRVFILSMLYNWHCYDC